MEKVTGAEALKTLPFRDIAIPKEEATGFLVTRTKKAVKENVAYLKTDIKGPNLQVISLALDDVVNTVDEWCCQGGFSMSMDEINYLYDKMGKSTFKEVADYVLTELYPKAIRENEDAPRNKGALLLGYFLDTIDLVKPEIASYEEKVAVIKEVLKEVKFAQFAFGVMADDALNLRGTEVLSFEFITGRREVSKFIEAYKSQLTDTELIEFNGGYLFSYADILSAFDRGPNETIH